MLEALTPPPSRLRPPGQSSTAAASRLAAPSSLRADFAALDLPTPIERKPIEFKATRSSFASWLADTGVADGIRKRPMGHTLGDVTEGHYSRRNPAPLAQAVATIALVWIGGTRPAEVPSGTTAEANPSK